jgi:leucyl/phenylalanyl-tRNA--protein transferase
MFHHETDASKVALLGLVGILDDGLERIVDTQWVTPHLASLGVGEVSRADYLQRLLPPVLATPEPVFEPGTLAARSLVRRRTTTGDAAAE